MKGIFENSKWHLGLLIIFLFSSTTQAATLGLADYLEQVRNKHQGAEAASLVSKGAAKRAADGYLQAWPFLFGLAQHSVDKKDDTLTGLDQMTRSTYSLGVSETTSLGLTAKLSYQFNYISFDTLTPATRPATRLWEGKPILELSQSLLRNFLGAEFRAGMRLAESAALSLSFAESYRLKAILWQAESAYWNLSFARSAVKIQESVLKDADELYKWAKSRVQLQLADKSDRLQAEALQRLRQLELQNAHDVLKSSTRSFNELRGIDSDELAEEVDSVETASLKMPKREGRADNVKAAEQQKIAAEAQAILGKQKVLPVVEAYGSAAYNGSNRDRATALGDSFSNDQPAWVVGLRVNVPLNVPLMMKSIEGYDLEEEAAAKTYQRKVFEEESQYKELQRKIEEAQARLELLKTLESVQKEKKINERLRLNRARTTTFQVVQFEVEYAQVEINRLRTQAEILHLIAQLKTFGGEM